MLVCRPLPTCTYVMCLFTLHFSTKFAITTTITLPYNTHLSSQISYGVMMLAVFLAIDVLVHLLCSILHQPFPPPHGTHTPTTSISTHADSKKSVRYSDLCFVSAVDYNQLGFFLLANIFTGVVNFAVDTLNSGTVFSVIILVLYMACLMATFTTLHKLKLKIKL